jgi:hypothetical protein
VQLVQRGRLDQQVRMELDSTSATRLTTPCRTTVNDVVTFQGASYVATFGQRRAKQSHPRSEFLGMDLDGASRSPRLAGTARAAR